MIIKLDLDKWNSIQTRCFISLRSCSYDYFIHLYSYSIEICMSFQVQVLVPIYKQVMVYWNQELPQLNGNYKCLIDIHVWESRRLESASPFSSTHEWCGHSNNIMTERMTIYRNIRPQALFGRVDYSWHRWLIWVVCCHDLSIRVGSAISKKYIL